MEVEEDSKHLVSKVKHMLQEPKHYTSAQLIKMYTDEIMEWRNEELEDVEQ